LTKLKEFIKEIIKAIKKREMAILPGNLAYFIVLAIIPTLTILVYVASLFNISIDLVIDFINKVIPEDIANIVVTAISGKGIDPSVSLFIIIALFVSCNGTYAIIKTSNTLYKIEKSDEIKDRVKSVIILILIIALFIYLIIVPIFGNQIISLIKDITGLESLAKRITRVFNILKWPATFLLTYINIKLIYTIAPSSHIKSYTTTYGAIITTFLWSVATFIFSYYLKYFAHYDILYGNLSSIIILMIWIYILCFIFVLGMAINSTRYNDILKSVNNKK